MIVFQKRCFLSPRHPLFINLTCTQQSSEEVLLHCCCSVMLSCCSVEPHLITLQWLSRRLIHHCETLAEQRAHRHAQTCFSDYICVFVRPRSFCVQLPGVVALSPSACCTACTVASRQKGSLQQQQSITLSSLEWQRGHGRLMHRWEQTPILSQLVSGYLNFLFFFFSTLPDFYLSSVMLAVFWFLLMTEVVSVKAERKNESILEISVAYKKISDYMTHQSCWSTEYFIHILH